MPLDVNGVAWLEDWVRDFKGAVLVVSHDRLFLDRIINAVFSQLKMPETILSAQGLSKGYDQGPLFTDLDLELPRRRRLAILGPNGCGKSTLLRVLVQQEAPDTGTVVISTSQPDAAVANRPSVAWYNRILDELDPDTPAWRTIQMGLLAHSVPDKKVQRFLELFRLSEADSKKRIRELSGGQKARVALVRCLLSGANLLVLDEPTKHLDITATQVMERALVRHPGAVIVVSHDRLFVNKVASHQLVFDGRGRLFVQGHRARSPSGIADAAGGAPKARGGPRAPLNKRR